MENKYNLQRFVEAQDYYETYQTAMAELKNGQKQSHWIWFVFPQIAGLGKSFSSQFYGIEDLGEAQAYLAHPVLGKRLYAACRELKQQVESRHASPREILGGIDSVKVRSCLTLFDAVSPDDVFSECLETCYDGQRDGLTLKIIDREKPDKI